MGAEIQPATNPGAAHSCTGLGKGASLSATEESILFLNSHKVVVCVGGSHSRIRTDRGWRELFDSTVSSLTEGSSETGFYLCALE